MDYAFYDAASSEDFDRVVGEVQKDIVTDPEGHRSLTTVTLSEGSLDNPDQAEVVVHTRQWTPGQRFPKPIVTVVPLDDIADLQIKLPSQRMIRLPPRRESLHLPAPPFTTLHHHDDTIVASDQVMSILDAVQGEAGLDLNGTVKDLESTFNTDFRDIEPGVREGFVDLDEDRRKVRSAKDQLVFRLRTVWWEIMKTHPPDWIKSDPKSAVMDLIDHLEQGVARVPALLKEHQFSVEQLVHDMNALEDAEEATLNESHEVFSESIEEEVIGMPSIYETSHEAVTGAGFDSATFLDL